MNAKSEYQDPIAIYRSIVTAEQEQQAHHFLEPIAGNKRNQKAISVTASRSRTIITNGTLIEAPAQIRGFLQYRRHASIRSPMVEKAGEQCNVECIRCAKVEMVEIFSGSCAWWFDGRMGCCHRCAWSPDVNNLPVEEMHTCNSRLNKL